MSLIMVLIGYYLDYKFSKKRFVTDLKKGLSFLSILFVLFLMVFYMPGLGRVYAILSVGGILLPLILIIKGILRK